MASEQFSSLAISRAQLDNLESLGYQKMTPVQAQSLPHELLEEVRSGYDGDVICASDLDVFELEKDSGGWYSNLLRPDRLHGQPASRIA